MIKKCIRVLKVFHFILTHIVSFPHIVFLFSNNVRINTLVPTAVTARRAYTSACPVSSQSLVYTNGFFVSMHSLLICAIHTFTFFFTFLLFFSHSSYCFYLFNYSFSSRAYSVHVICCIQPPCIAFARG